MSFNTLVPLHDLLGIDRQPLVWIDHHTEKSRVRLKQKDIYLYLTINLLYIITRHFISKKWIYLKLYLKSVYNIYKKARCSVG